MPLPNQNNYTITDIYDLPEGTRAELIDGQIFYMAPPSTAHQRILNYLSTEINLYIRKKGGDCEVLPAPFAVFLNKDEKTYVEPDISIICDKDKINDKGCNGAPDWVIEIVSPSSRAMDYYTKLYEYKNAGVREYWIVDPIKKSVLVYNLEMSEAPVLYRFTDYVKANIYEDFEINFSLI